MHGATRADRRAPRGASPRWIAPILRLAEYGTAGYPPRVRRRLRVLNVMAGLVAVFSLQFAVTYALQDARAHAWEIAINVALVAAACTIPFAHRHGELAGAAILVVAEYAGLFALVALIGRQSGIHLNLIAASTVLFAVLGLERVRLIAALLAVGSALHVAAWFLFPEGLHRFDPDFLAQLYVSSALTVFAVTAAIAFYAFGQVERAEQETEALLRNILPDAIAERLKRAPGEPVAESVAEASVLFSDLVSFVTLAKALGPARTVQVLDDLVRGFDALAVRHGVEKIKTIGDAYMAVAGLPEPASDHATRLAAMALAMRDTAHHTARRHGIELTLRIGIASGPVMAGVIGARKFSYDVWGDAVNLASRLEHSCDSGCIHVCPDLRRRLPAEFRVSPRGPTEIRGFGRIETFLLVGRGPVACAEAA